MRARVGSIVRSKGRGKSAKPTWWARVTYTDPVTGKKHDRQRRAESKVNAGELVHELLAEVDSTGGQSLARQHMTFLDLATYFEKQYLKPAEYVDGRKVAGVRSISPAMAPVKALNSILASVSFAVSLTAIFALSEPNGSPQKRKQGNNAQSPPSTANSRSSEDY